MDETFANVVWETSRRADVLDAVAAVYADVAAEIAARKPICDLSGRCCKFESYGHRLYVSTLELAAFIAGQGLPSKAEWDGAGCPFQRGKLCGVHARRPFGCRMFFCDPTADDWQTEAYERFHHRLKALHDELGVPYAYVEWRSALSQLGLAQAPAAV